MEKLVTWLVDLENKASETYENLASKIENDKNFVKLLLLLAEDEAMHFHFLNSALICLKNHSHIRSEIALDDETKTKIERPFQKIREMIDAGIIDRASIAECIVRSENSEWNNIFLYVANKLKSHCALFKYIGPSIQHHLRKIDQYLDKIPELSDAAASIKKLQPIWNEKILIVDDSKPIADLLSATLSSEWIVHTAENGAEGFKKACAEYYAVIVSDIDMPVMSGVEFYQKMESDYPDIGKRFIFISGEPTSGNAEFVRRKGLRFLSKPFTFHDIRENLFQVMDKIVL